MPPVLVSILLIVGVESVVKLAFFWFSVSIPISVSFSVLILIVIESFGSVVVLVVVIILVVFPLISAVFSLLLLVEAVVLFPIGLLLLVLVCVRLLVVVGIDVVVVVVEDVVILEVGVLSALHFSALVGGERETVGHLLEGFGELVELLVEIAVADSFSAILIFEVIKLLELFQQTLGGFEGREDLEHFIAVFVQQFGAINEFEHALGGFLAAFEFLDLFQVFELAIGHVLDEEPFDFEGAEPFVF